MVALVLAAALLCLITGVFIGFVVASTAEVKKGLRSAGFTKESAQLYHRAAKLLNGMVRITDLDGPFGEDVLSEPTKKQVNDWLADYRKQVHN